jgi:RNA polymerase sigma-70 factor (ECF subfamily)
MEEFETYRPLLLSIAYRMLASASEAEDIVQEAYLRYRSASIDEVRSLKSYLTTIVTNLCLDYLKSARVQRTQYIGPWLPEPVLTKDANLLLTDTVEQRESISFAFLVLLERLTPPERAVFLLHEVFDYPFQEIAQIIDKPPTTCRQIFHRAKEHLAERRQRFTPSPETQQQLMMRFAAACQSGNLPALTALLKQDVVSWSDGGGKTRAALRPIIGASNVARYWLSLNRKYLADYKDFSLTINEVNGQLSALGWEGSQLVFVINLNIVDQHIASIHAILNPDKLAYIQQQLKAMDS